MPVINRDGGLHGHGHGRVRGQQVRYHRAFSVLSIDRCCGAEYVHEAEAALTKMDIRGAHVDVEVFAGLKGVAHEGCEILWT
jgi:hypothetical protein